MTPALAEVRYSLMQRKRVAHSSESFHLRKIGDMVWNCPQNAKKSKPEMAQICCMGTIWEFSWEQIGDKRESTG